MYEEILSKIGLTDSEIAVYFALLGLGPSTTGPIIKEAKIASGKAYLVLNKLVSKGLVTYMTRSGVKYFQAKDPEQLLDYIDGKQEELQEKKESLKRIIPELKSKYEEFKYKPSAEIYEGVKGLKAFMDFIIRESSPGDTVDILGVPKIADERFHAYLMEWNRKRVEKGVKVRLVYNNDCRDVGKARGSFKLTQIRYLKKELETPVWIDMFKDYVVTLNVYGNPTIFQIKDKATAESYKRYFEFIWDRSDK